jgi:DNA-binding NtrC family response regulator
MQDPQNKQTTHYDDTDLASPESNFGLNGRSSGNAVEGVGVSVGMTIHDAERLLILSTLEQTHNNKTRAAEILGVSVKTLHNKLKAYNAKENGHLTPVSAGARGGAETS